MSAECVLLALCSLGLPEAVKTRERLAKSCHNCCQNQRVKSYPTDMSWHTIPGLTTPV